MSDQRLPSSFIARLMIQRRGRHLGEGRAHLERGPQFRDATCAFDTVRSSPAHRQDDGPLAAS